MLKDDKLKWQRPKYASETKSVLEETNNDEEYPERNDEPLFCEEGELFTKSSSSGDVIQGRLGDCWFFGAISVLATRMELLIQAFWREDQYQQHGMFICRFMKDFPWHYVIIDDRIPVFEYNNNRAGKPLFARCSDPNELWVPLLEKAYAKLHGSYVALIGGYIHKQVLGTLSFGDDPFAREEPGDAFWRRLLDYRRNVTLMGCSIQPDPKIAKNDATEGSAGQGLYYKHAYGLIDVGEIKLEDNKIQCLVKLRGTRDGPWSDQSDEREKYDSEIQRVFKTVSRNSGANGFTSLQRQRKLCLVMEPQVPTTTGGLDTLTFLLASTLRTSGGVANELIEVSNGGNVSKTVICIFPSASTIQEGLPTLICFPSDSTFVRWRNATMHAYEVKEPPKKLLRSMNCILQMSSLGYAMELSSSRLRLLFSQERSSLASTNTACLSLPTHPSKQQRQNAAVECINREFA